MATKQVNKHLIQITRFGMVNCYLVIEDDGATLVDTGLAGMGSTIIDVAATEKVPIRRVLLTHAHVDHAGALDELGKALPDAEFLYTPRTARFLVGEVRLEPGEPEKKIKGGFPRRETKATREIADGDEIGSLTVHASPGHSPDHVAFLDRRDGTLIAGDSFQTKGGIAVSGVMRWRFPLPALATWDLALATESASQLVAMAPKRLAPGHGAVLEEPVEAMSRAVEEARTRLKS
jgi:glyoxylase-like metal-dependent hydrolase (beta-lactamase superfamily II)